MIIEFNDVCETGIYPIPEIIKISSKYGIQEDIYLELWKKEDYYNYFTITKEESMLYNPYNKRYQEHRGFYIFEDNIHKICIITDVDDWKFTLRHELTHAKQSELIGNDLYKKCFDILKPYREFDPFEIQAYMNEERVYG